MEAIRSRSKKFVRRAMDGDGGDEVGADLDRHVAEAIRHRQIRSMMVAVPMPPPVHMVTRPVDRSWRSSSSSSGADEHAAGGADRVAERHRAAVDVDLVPVDAGVAEELEHHGGERLVDLEQVDVVERHARPSRRSGSRPARAR